MKILELCDKVIEDAGKATNRPWKAERENTATHVHSEKVKGADGYCIAITDLASTSKEASIGGNAEYIVTSANSAETLAKAVKVLVDRLQFISQGCLVPPDGGSPKHPEDDIWSAREALAQAEALVEGK